MAKVIYDVQPLLVNLPDLPIEGGSVVKRKGELVQFVYEPLPKLITVVYDVVPFNQAGDRITGGIIQPYRAVVTADYNTFVAEDDGHFLCNANEEYIDSALNPILVGKQYMYRYEWHNRNGWDVHRVIMDGIRIAIYDDFMRTNYPPSQAVIETVYNSLKTPLPGSLSAENYQASRIAELGQKITLNGSARTLNSITICLVTWGYQSKYGLLDATWNCDVTLNLYAVNESDNTIPGQQLLSITKPFAINWRPEPDASCGDTRWLAPEGCKNGQAFTIDLDTLETITLPDELIFGIAFNTQNGGANPIGAVTPSNDLAFAVNFDGTGIGSAPAERWMNSSEPTVYADGGVAGVGIFRKDVGTPYYSLAISIDAQ